MISLSHWSLRYARDKAKAALYAWRHPRVPWLTRQAVGCLTQHLGPSQAGFEWGSGRSTAWLADRIRSLTSVESDPTWFARVQKLLRAKDIRNVALHFLDADSPQYVALIDEEVDQSLDFVLVDGVSERRDSCALAAVPKVRPGGLLIVDDVHRYLPSDSVAPHALAPGDNPLTPTWEEFASRVADWPLHWTTDGVRDTAIWRCPEETHLGAT